MRHAIHFISGLPRSGSTLLASILRQNPTFHATMTSPIGGIFHTLLGEVSRRNDFSYFISERQKRALLKGLFVSFYEDYDDKTIFDTHRWWCLRAEALFDLFPGSKIIACVRDVPWIIDSIERLVRKNAFELSAIFRYEPLLSVYTRADAAASPAGLLGLAWQALKQVYYGNETERLILVSYESLTSSPSETLKALYDFLGETHFVHDFDNVEFNQEDWDREWFGTPGLHSVRRKVERVERDTILPPDLFYRFQSDSFWKDPKMNTRHVEII